MPENDYPVRPASEVEILTETILKELETLMAEMRLAMSGKHGSKAAAKRARKRMRSLKKPTTGEFATWIKLSVEEEKQT